MKEEPPTCLLFQLPLILQGRDDHQQRASEFTYVKSLKQDESLSKNRLVTLHNLGYNRILKRAVASQVTAKWKQSFWTSNKLGCRFLFTETQRQKDGTRHFLFHTRRQTLGIMAQLFSYLGKRCTSMDIITNRLGWGSICTKTWLHPI